MMAGNTSRLKLACFACAVVAGFDMVLAAEQFAGGRLEEPIENLTLERALEIALQNHPQAAELAALAEASKGRLEEAGSFPNPEAVGRIESAPLNGNTTRQAEYVAGISQPLPLGGRVSAAKRVAQAEKVQIDRENEVVFLKIQTRVRNAFATALFASELARVHSNLVHGSEQTIGLVRRRVEAGDAPSTELLRAEAEAANEQLNLRRAATAERKSILALGAALGNPALLICSLAGGLEEALAVPTLETIVAELSLHPALAAAEATLQAQQARLDLAKAERIPDLNLDLLYRRLQGSRENAFDAGIRLEIPVFNRGRGRIRASQANIRAAEARLRGTRAELEQAFEEHRLDLASSLETAEMLKQEILPRVSEALRIAEVRYEAGDTSLSALLLARREFTLAQLEQLEALHAVLQAWAGLMAVARP